MHGIIWCHNFLLERFHGAHMGRERYESSHSVLRRAGHEPSAAAPDARPYDRVHLDCRVVDLVVDFVRQQCLSGELHGGPKYSGGSLYDQRNLRDGRYRFHRNNQRSRNELRRAAGSIPLAKFWTCRRASPRFGQPRWLSPHGSQWASSIAHSARLQTPLPVQTSRPQTWAWFCPRSEVQGLTFDVPRSRVIFFLSLLWELAWI